MKPLLSIQTVPISIEYKSKRASLEVKSEPPSVHVSRERGGFTIQRESAQIHIDSTETRASLGLKSPFRSVRDFAQAGKQAGLEATKKLVEDGNQIMESHGKGNPIIDIARSNLRKNYDMVLTFSPSTPPQISVENGSLSIEYTMDKLTFDWNINHKPYLEFTPGNLEFSVSRYPRVEIEYVGDPIYVPPSANPNYEPPASIDETV